MALAAPETSSLRPVTAGHRIEILDELRGFAILGILLVNVSLFFSPIYLAISDNEWWRMPADRFVASAVVFLAQGKFYTLFSLLFGIGMSLQLERLEARGVPANRFFARRLVGLLLIGLAHAFLLWFGDILVTYAIAGFLLLALRSLPDRALLILGTILVFLPLAGFTAMIALVEFARLSSAGTESLDAMLAAQATANSAAMEVAVEAYRHGNFFEVVGARAGEVMVVWSSWMFALPNILGLFVVGFVAGRRHVMRSPDVAVVRRWLPRLAPIGIVGAALQTWALAHDNPGSPSITTWVGHLGTSVGGPALCLTYVGGIVLLARTRIGRRLLSPLAPVGRMALTNYLTHSIVFTTLALPWGLGLYGDVRPAIAVPAAIALWLMQIPLSRWWLARFRFGPFEWLWRSMTYGAAQPMRIRSDARL